MEVRREEAGVNMSVVVAGVQFQCEMHCCIFVLSEKIDRPRHIPLSSSKLCALLTLLLPNLCQSWAVLLF